MDVNDIDRRRLFLRRRLPQAIDQLRPETTPTWGRMTAQHMVEHLIWMFELSSGEQTVDCPTPPARLRRIKRFLYDDAPMPREFMNPVLPEGPPPLRYASLSAAVQALKTEVDRYATHFSEHPDAVRVHPVFGPLGAEEWERSHYKHGVHHLRQFGLLAPVGVGRAGIHPVSRGPLP